MALRPYIANTDRMWFNFLSHMAAAQGPSSQLVAEANFWFPNAKKILLRSIGAGMPVF
jgi:hypothetical protein